MTTVYSWRLLRAGAFRLDGGSMFGIIPRVVWSRAAPPDDRGRIPVHHNCLLLQRDGPGNGPRLVLVEAGTGDKLDDRSRDLFALQDRSIVDALLETGTEPERIDAVVVTHLHFDHAGGLTRRCRPGESPDWTGPASCFAGARPDHPVKRTFPNATVHVQQREWADALANKSVMTRTYFRDHLEPIRDQVRTVDSPRPFPPGAVPLRDAMPPAPLALRQSEILPGISVFLAPGHTWGQQAVKFQDPSGRSVVFTPDFLPTVNHVGAAYNLAYDVEPYTSTLTRRWFLHAAADENWTLVLDHEPGDPVRRVRRTQTDWFELVSAEP
jgi:glyoxylase-like metal-dependent hydrolase (beta-lactamase superfamily II)